MPETTQSSAEGRSEVREEGVLSNMEVFTIDLRRGIIVFYNAWCSYNVLLGSATLYLITLAVVPPMNHNQ